MSKYFVIKKTKYNYPKEHFRFDIVKDSEFDLEKATKILLAYETINDNEDVSFHLQQVDLLLTKSDTQPLVLTKEVDEDGIPIWVY